MGDSSALDINLMVFSEDSPISLSHLLMGFVFPGIGLFFGDLVGVLFEEFLCGVHDGIAEVATLLEGVVLFVPFEQESLSVVLHFSFVFLLFDQAEVLFFEQVSFEELVFAQKISLFEIS